MAAARWKRLLFDLLVVLFLPVFLLAALLPARRKTLIWGSAPLIPNKYWSEAMKRGGWESLTVMSNLYPINRRSDFDRYFEDFTPRALPGPLRYALGACLALVFVLRRGRVLHTSFWGFSLGLSAFWRLESALLRLAGVKTVVMPFGADAYIYSRTIDTSLRYGLLASYPHLARQERSIRAKVEHWSEHADVVIAGPMVDGIGRWDVTLNQIFVIDTEAWPMRSRFSEHDGRTGPVKVLHSPNHRGFKATEYVEEAVRRLREEGLQVELVLLERVPNEQVKGLMQEVDILAEQFLFTGYAMNGIEGMASGLPVMSNLEHEAYTRVHRRYGFLDECPILSTTPETLTDHLRLLVTGPALRRTLGMAGRAYVEKYHSDAMAHHLFGSIYDKLLEGKEVDLINLFHPLKSEYNRRLARVDHPLVDSKLPTGK